MTRVSVSAQNSSSRCVSAFERASLETSSPKIAPTSPRHTRETICAYPFLACVSENRPEIPRSPSTTTIRSASQPSLAASSASAYCRSVERKFSRTCRGEDWRKYTTASRSKCELAIFCWALTIDATRRQRRLDHVREHRDRLGQHAWHRSLQRPPPQQLQVDLRDLLKQRLVALRELD